MTVVVTTATTVVVRQKIMIIQLVAQGTIIGSLRPISAIVVFSDIKIIQNLKRNMSDYKVP